jgi:hypothetical protein
MALPRLASISVLLTTLSSIAGCVTAKPVPLPDGRQGFSIENCDSMAQCYRKAADACGGGKYSLVDQGSETVAVATGAAGVFTASASPQYNLLIVCE